MHSIRTKITALTISAIIIVITITTLVSTLEIKKLGNETSEQILFLMCEEGEKNLDAYFNSVRRSVETISGYAQKDLEDSGLDDLSGHLERVEGIFEKAANNTNGVLTYYYRIDPEISTTNKGFWYVNLDGKGFKEHEVTDITQYDTNDQSQLVWFTVPKKTAKAVWLPPYHTDNLGVYVFSYNVPIHIGDRFVGVIGIEIDYNEIAQVVKSITLYKNGYAFINDSTGSIIYNPRIEISEYTDGKTMKVPDGLLSDSAYVRYNFDGVEKQAVWLPLNNGMRLNVTVPVKEINAGWVNLINKLFAISLILLIVFTLLTIRLALRITRPLRKLTKAAALVDEGNYDVKLDYDKDDEVGALTNTFNHLISHLKVYIKELNDLAYSDPLTYVHNRGAFDIYIRDIQKNIEQEKDKPEFAVGIFDCNDLKIVNDRFGHKKGDLYLQAAVCLICDIFRHSPVFRIGGDEFAVILRDEDYKNRDKLAKEFVEHMAEISAKSEEIWKKVNLSMGIAAYDPQTDLSAHSVVSRADALMYKNKEQQKNMDK